MATVGNGSDISAIVLRKKEQRILIDRDNLKLVSLSKAYEGSGL
ncbi:MAG: hypothetical protein ABI254_17070 [Chthoniobacterales bacterium]